ncbi:hypothetical protein [Brevundimonas goettingensis]|uniref:CinY protein n=1 Tax=Brevundimonas goettingensis TaxID=2774190 RepID=A0A975C2J6_9CAUL|nr:hypothetical protein [Brevundimonas goettingensis]QTC91889.1 CinY protein [Brevundimonas goettingensis]
MGISTRDRASAGWRRGPLLIGLAVLMATWAPRTGQAFGTVAVFGQHEEHAKITALALKDSGLGPMTLWVFGGGRGKFGAVGAPDRPGRGLILNGAAHCDGGDWLPRDEYRQTRTQAADRLRNCRAFVFDRLEDAVTAAGQMLDARGRPIPAQIAASEDCRFRGKDEGPARCRALENMGLVFHTTQDFYSHTNWTDAPVSAATPFEAARLGHDAPAPWMASTEAAFPEGLVSGCFKFVPEFLFCRGRVRHADLNKDEGLIDMRDPAASTDGKGRGADGGFARAVTAAVADSRSKWTLFETRLAERYGPERGRRMACLIRSDDPGACAPS